MSGQSPTEKKYRAETRWREVDTYFSDALLEEDTALIPARLFGAQTTMPIAEVAPNQGTLLALIARITGAKRILEFGTLAGYSTIWLARAVGSGARVVTLEVDDQNAAIARHNVSLARVGQWVDVEIGAAIETARQLIAEDVEPCALVIIGADKPSKPQYLAVAIELTRPGAVILIDDVVRDGAVVEHHSDDPRVRGEIEVIAAIAEHPDLEANALQTVGSGMGRCDRGSTTLTSRPPCCWASLSCQM